MIELRRRPELIEKAFTERAVRLGRYGSLIRLAGGELVKGPRVVRGVRATSAKPTITLHYDRWVIADDRWPVILWIMTPSPGSVSIAAWKVPARGVDGVFCPTITIVRS